MLLSSSNGILTYSDPEAGKDQSNQAKYNDCEPEECGRLKTRVGQLCAVNAIQSQDVRLDLGDRLLRQGIVITKRKHL